jgi:hypothetical protein
VFVVLQGSSTPFGKGPQPILWADSRAVCVKITISGVRSLRHYFVIFKVYVTFTNVAAGRITQPSWPRFGHPCSIGCREVRHGLGGGITRRVSFTYDVCLLSGCTQCLVNIADMNFMVRWVFEMGWKFWRKNLLLLPGFEPPPVQPVAFLRCYLNIRDFLEISALNPFKGKWQLYVPLLYSISCHTVY